jgi:hypothetical protein
MMTSTPLQKLLDIPWHGFFTPGIQIEPMSKMLCEIWLSFGLAEAVDKHDDLDKQLAERGAKDFCYQVLDQRLKVVGSDTKVSPAVKVICSLLSEGSPGEAVMWAYSLHYLLVAENLSKITLTDLSNYFPMGFPTKEARHTVWDAQKGYKMIEDGRLDSSYENVDNWVDNFDNWPKRVEQTANAEAHSTN